jgi:hypothetical protein
LIKESHIISIEFDGGGEEILKGFMVWGIFVGLLLIGFLFPPLWIIAGLMLLAKLLKAV